jgi:hypothetical protein
VSKKDFELIARVLRDERARYAQYRTTERFEAQIAAVDGVARAMAEDLAHTNPRFDRERFLATCGVENNS